MRTLTDLAIHLNLATRRAGFPALALLTDTRRLPDPLPVIARLPPGSWVVLRHYDSPERLALGRQLAQACRQKRLRLLVAGDFPLAMELGAGLHLPEALAARASARIRLWHKKPGRPLTVAAHGRQALVRAARLAADAALLAPVFPTLSHPGQPSLGTLAFRRLVRGARLPVYALGGVTVATIGRLRGSGTVGIATVGGLGRSPARQESSPHPE